MNKVSLDDKGYTLCYTVTGEFLFWLERQEDPEIVARCGASLDGLWAQALPHNTAEPQPNVPLPPRVVCHRAGVETSLDAARRGACATSGAVAQVVMHGGGDQQ